MKFKSFILLITLMFSGMLASGQLYITLPITSEIADYYGINQNMASLVGTSFGISYALGFLFWGPISDHFGRYLSLQIGIALTCLATFGTSMASSFYLEILFRILQGISAASIPPIGLALLSETLPVKMRSLGLALMSFSFIVAAPVAQFYAKVTGINFSLLMLWGGCSFAICLLTLMFLGPNNFAKHTTHSYSLKSNLKTLISNKIIISAWTVSITVLFSFVVFQTLLHQSLNIDAWNEATITILTISGMLASFIAGKFINKFGGIFIASLGMLLSALALVIAFFYKPLLGLVIVLFSIGIAITLPSIISIVSIQANNLCRGMAISIYSFVIFLGASLAPVYIQFVNLKHDKLLLLPIFLLILSFVVLGIIGLRFKNLDDLKNTTKVRSL